MQVPMDSAEQLLNFIVHHTDLYMRTKRNETPAEHDARWRAAFKKLSPFLMAMKDKVRTEERAACAKICERVAEEYGEDERARGAFTCSVEIRKSNHSDHSCRTETENDNG